MSMTGLGLEWSRRKHPELRRKLQAGSHRHRTATTTAATTARAADWGFSRHQRSMRRRWLVVRPVRSPSPPPPPRHGHTVARIHAQ